MQMSFRQGNLCFPLSNFHKCHAVYVNRGLRTSMKSTPRQTFCKLLPRRPPIIFILSAHRRIYSPQGYQGPRVHCWHQFSFFRKINLPKITISKSRGGKHWFIDSADEKPFPPQSIVFTFQIFSINLQMDGKSGSSLQQGSRLPPEELEVLFNHSHNGPDQTNDGPGGAVSIFHSSSRVGALCKHDSVA